MSVQIATKVTAAPQRAIARSAPRDWGDGSQVALRFVDAIACSLLWPVRPRPYDNHRITVVDIGILAGYRRQLPVFIGKDNDQARTVLDCLLLL
jgi:hypothetical protein